MFTDPRFYLCIAASYVLVQLAPQRWRSTWFGALNLAALHLLLDPRVFNAFIPFIAGFWVLLGVQQWLARKGYNAVAFLGLVGLYALAGGLFVFHKSFLDSYGLLMPLHDMLVNIPGAEKAAKGLTYLVFSYVFLRMWDVIRSVSEGERLLNPVALSGYILPFFMISVGPVNVYADHVAMDKTAPEAPRFNNFFAHVELIVTGLFFKIVVAELYRQFFVGVETWKLQNVWQTGVAFVYVFFDFYGYSLVALGIGRLLGVPTPVNFNRPFASRSLTEFWTRWHMSLGNFVRKNIFTPLQVVMVRRFGVKHAYQTGLFALVVSFSFVGVWHRFTPHFLLWGMAVGSIMIVEKLMRDKVMPRWRTRYPALISAWHYVGPVYVFVAVVVTLHLVIKQLMGAS